MNEESAANEMNVRVDTIVRPRLLDLYCCAGGAGMGYARAGFEITGVDVVRHKRNPHPVIEADALSLEPEWIAANFDAIHASPPCQGYSAMKHAPGAKGAPRLIGATRELLQATGLPWVIENVEMAASEMLNPVTLCGTMLGLGAQGHDLHRHRLFETSFSVAPLACRHTERPVIGVYGGHARCRSAKHGGRKTRDVWEGGHKAAATEALGIDWMTLGELSEAIPPAYTEYLGWQLRCDDIDMKHELKTLPNYFEAIEQGLKKFEIRNNTDRGFQKGDLVVLKEHTSEVRFGALNGGYTGREIMAEITYVTNYQQQPGYVVFGFTRLDT